MEELVPGAARVGEEFGDLPDARLLPAEEPHAASAEPGRRAEFATVRVCARRALRALGRPEAPLVPGPGGAPLWPPGVVGSMTHCAGYRAAVVADAAELAAVGVDAEPHLPLSAGVVESVALPAERTALRELAVGSPGVCWDRVLFSAKESVYKVWYPLTGRWLDFEQALVSVDPDGTFTARLLVPGPVVCGTELTGLTGRWLARGGLVATALTVPAVRPG